MGHPTLSFEQVKLRDEQILAYADLHPEISNTALGNKYQLSRETIRLVLARGRRVATRNARLTPGRGAYQFSKRHLPEVFHG